MVGYWTLFYVCLITVLLFQLVLSAGYGLATRKIHFLHYSGFLLSAALLHTSRYAEVVAQTFTVWEWVLWLKPVYSFISYYFYFRFARSFLNLGTLHQGIDKLAAWLQWISLLYLPFCLLPQGFWLRISAFALTGVVLALGTLWLQIRLLAYRNAILRLIQLGSLIYFLVMLIGFLDSFGISPMPMVTTIDWAGLGSILEVMFFSLALAFTLKLEGIEKEKAQGEALQRLEEVHALHQTLQEVRDRIARDMHDDVSSGLGTISLLSAMAEDHITKERPALDIVRKMGQLARETGESMNDAIWALNTANDEGTALIKRMKDFSGLILGSAGIRFGFETGTRWATCPMDMQQRKNLYLIFKEALYNIVKHSCAGNVQIDLMDDTSGLWLIIGDDGIGIKPDHRPLGNGIRNMGRRAEESGFDISFGHSPLGGLQLKIFLPLPQSREIS